jgi:hypothetical protein
LKLSEVRVRPRGLIVLPQINCRFDDESCACK